MKSPYVVVDATYHAVQELFVGPIREEPTSQRIQRFCHHFWGHRYHYGIAAALGSLSLVVHYTCDLPLPEGMLIGSGATLVLLALGGSCKKPKTETSDSSADTSYLIDPSPEIDHRNLYQTSELPGQLEDVPSGGSGDSVGSGGSGGSSPLLGRAQRGIVPINEQLSWQQQYPEASV